jgi:SHS2 domain-containing protein
MSIDSKIAEILEESKLAGMLNEHDSEEEHEHEEESVEEVPAEESAAEEVVEESIKVDVSADVAALINGESLSEEFKTKASTIFEAAVITRVKEEVTRLEEEFESKLAEQVDAITEGLVEKIDGYLDYVVEQWMEQNEIALENGVKGDIMESFITGMRDLFKEHYIEVPEEKYDVIGEMESRIDELSTKLDEQVERNVEMRKSLQESARKEIVKMSCEGLAKTDEEKFLSLVEELSFEDEETFQVKVQTIRENYFNSKPSTIIESVVTDSPVQELVTESAQHVDPMVAMYAKAIKQLNI